MATISALEDTTWELEGLLDGRSVDDLLDDALQRADAMTAERGKLAGYSGADLERVMRELEALSDLVGRAQSYAHLRFATDTADEARGALVQKVGERATEIHTRLIFFDLEWAALDDEAAERLLAHEGLEFCRHYLRSQRRYRDHLLTEPEERILSEKRITGASAWERLFEEHTSAIKVRLDGEEVNLEAALSRLQHPDREVRREAAVAVTEGLQPGLRTRAFIFNTLLQDKAVNDRLRRYPHWLASRNLANEATDESVAALVEAVTSRYDIPQRWYALKAQLLGVDRLADYDRMAPVTSDNAEVPWEDATRIVLDGYRSFSGELAALCERFFAERWIDAPLRPGKRNGAFCSYTVPSHHPYVMLNYTARRRDVLTLAHELGHGVHAALARPRGIFHQSTPLTLAETASVFGETVVFGRLLDMADTAESRLSLLAEHVEGAIATVFRQVAMNRFEDAVHNERRTAGELPVERFNELWDETQSRMLGDPVEITPGYRTWWSYIPHFIGTPGYVYAYAYGQLLALSVYRRYEERGESFVPRYLEMLSAGGSMPPEQLGKVVDCDLTDPGFWSGGIAIIEEQLKGAEEAADAANLTPR
ncbi:MAG TPA: M3 family oligoendopeptidase [Actinomycetota bacterium]|jgi:oligoendopeptidase F|nr:M3 family oligoendopeptidase [Actinomycetota bacterium]